MAILGPPVVGRTRSLNGKRRVEKKTRRSLEQRGWSLVHDQAKPFQANPHGLARNLEVFRERPAIFFFHCVIPLFIRRRRLAAIEEWRSRMRGEKFSEFHGPVIAAGLNSWHGRAGNYWGHNAIIRTRAFAAAAGLPELPGRKPF
ncbi:MAG: hypothetical protein N2689_17755, partial [Verrucomicrobiae bacterium]|nr:hypothetical protein [Verrucomicrobiae bacterium]